ncbi:hypothetical protein V2J09_005385 [Rumex salicifolius]
MAGLIRSLRRTALSPHSRALAQLLQPSSNEISASQVNAHFQIPQIQNRSYVSDMRRKAFNENILRLLRNEIQYEFDRSPPQQPPTEVNGFTVNERPGEQWVSLEKRFGDKEEIKVEVTMFDGSVPVPKYEDGKSGQLGDEVILHITLIVSIFKDDNDKVLVFMCSAWPEEVEINKIYIRSRGQMANNPYMGPPFQEMDDQMQNSLYDFLETRGIDDALSAFLHKYVPKKDKSEYVRWLNNTVSFMKQRAA